ncbi:small cysteine-rich protein 1 1-like isoform X1 [Dendronephthya gigantea]|uniref:small cysteine-rich protein 1 1-like isoform X1 n=1 Tax=Dendronephthya gigantea TaxID=151771 RepID=UPI00106C6AA5|nr:small cysteine-rich protein 1 1-like isoform X1 [Dendronephthya gigantea]
MESALALTVWALSPTNSIYIRVNYTTPVIDELKFLSEVLKSLRFGLQTEVLIFSQQMDFRTNVCLLLIIFVAFSAVNGRKSTSGDSAEEIPCGLNGNCVPSRMRCPPGSFDCNGFCPMPYHCCCPRPFPPGK